MSGVLDNLFETRSMLPALMQMRAPTAFLRNLFFKQENTFDTEAVDIDIYKEAQRRAAHVRLYQEGTLMERQDYSTYTYKPFPLKPTMITTAREAFRRGPGEALYNSVSPMARAQATLARDLLTMVDAIGRTEELMCSQALFNDAVKTKDVRGNDLAADISFGRAADHNVSSAGVTSGYGGLWDASGSDPLETLRKLKRKVAKDSGFVPTVAVFAGDITDMFLSHSVIRDMAKDTRSSQIDIQMRFPTYLTDGAVYVGRFEGLDVFEYMGTIRDDYTDPDNPTVVDLVPAKKILLGNPDARSEMLYGAVDDLDSLAPVARFPKSWRENNPSAQFVQVISRPLPAPHQVDSYIVAQVDA